MSAAAEQKEADFSDTPEGWANRWAHEVATAREKLKDWHKQGGEVVRRYRDDRDAKDKDDVRWNLFTSSVETKMATLYGQTPKVAAERRYADANDDVGRVAAEVLERILNADFEKDSDTAEDAFRYALEDRLLPGAGLVRVRYEVQTKKGEATPAQVDEATGRELAPVVPGLEEKHGECVKVDYVHWRDVLWGPARVWHEVPWLAYRNEMPREEVARRFGEDVATRLPMQGGAKGKDGDEKGPTPWQRAHVWEIWDKATKRVFWWVEGYPKTLDMKEDPYGLDGFFPSPKPLLSLVTTTALVPKPEYHVAQDLYREVDSLSARIDALTDAVRLRGAYDAATPELGEVLTKPDNALVPVRNWAAFGEKGGLAAAIQFLPLEQVAATIQVLSERRAVAKDALFEVTGQADIMRGAQVAGEAATTGAIKAKFGSVRLQRQQDEFARFVTATVRLKAQLVARFYDEAAILEQSNLAMTEDGKRFGQAAVAFIKSGQTQFRIDVKPEAVALQDFAQLKSDALDLMTGMTGFLQAAAPIAQAVPGSMPFLLKLLGASVARMRGASTLEGIIDGAIAAAEADAQHPQQQASQGPTPEQMKLQTQQLKGQQDLAKEDKKLSNDLVRYQAEAQMKGVQEATQREQNVLEARQKAAISAATRPMPGGMP